MTKEQMAAAKEWIPSIAARAENAMEEVENGLTLEEMEDRLTDLSDFCYRVINTIKEA